MFKQIEGNRFSFYPRGGMLKLGIGCPQFNDQEGRAWLYFCFLWGVVYLKLWKKTAWFHENLWSSYSFDFNFKERTIHLYWGEKWKKIIYMPWHWDHVKHEVLTDDGTWQKAACTYGKDKEEENRVWEEHDYTYILKNGTVQSRKAKICIERREWRWMWLKWLPFPRMVRKTIEVKFNEEVGERSGSWKGGCVRCGYEMLPGETALDTLRRMEKERKF